MALSDIVKITLTTQSAKATRPGFGVPMIMASDCPAGFVERVRSYSSLAGLAVDFTSAAGATYRMAQAIFSQEPCPPAVMVGRCANKYTQRFAVTPIAANSTKYEILVGGTLVTFTSDASATVTEIIAGLKTAIDLLGLDVTVSDQGAYMRILTNTAGTVVQVKSLNVSLLGVVQDHADPGIAADILAIDLENSGWYTPLHPAPSKAIVDAISDYCEASTKLYVATTLESDVIRLADGADTGGSQTVAGLLKADAKFRTALIYHPDSVAFADAAWAGACLPLDSGSETWADKTLAGVSVVGLTETQRTNALAKFANVYESMGGLSLTNFGKVSGNEYVDVIRFRDWLAINMQVDILEAKTRSKKKIPYTNRGIKAVVGVIEARLQKGVDAQGLAEDPHFTVTAPTAAQISAADKAARKLTGVVFTATLAGAIQAADISGVLSV